MNAFALHMAEVSRFAKREGFLFWSCNLSLWDPSLPNEKQHVEAWAASLAAKDGSAWSPMFYAPAGSWALEKLTAHLRSLK